MAKTFASKTFASKTFAPNTFAGTSSATTTTTTTTSGGGGATTTSTTTTPGATTTQTTVTASPRPHKPIIDKVVVQNNANQEIIVYANRTTDLDGSLYQRDGVTPFNFLSTDVLRWKMGRRSTVRIDLRSGVPSANGSLLSITSRGDSSNPATYHLRIAQGDIATIVPGVYDGELLLVDTNDPAAPGISAQTIDLPFIVHVIPDMGGNIGA